MRAYSTSTGGGDNDDNSAGSNAALDASQLTHVDAKTGRPTMVDVGHKQVTRRSACARTVVVFPPEVAQALQAGGGELQSAKGPVLATAIVAGVM
jgi:cyclic pyranopterin phosphate synthase